MQISIHINTDENDLSPWDRAVLLALAGETDAPAAKAAPTEKSPSKPAKKTAEKAEKEPVVERDEPEDAKKAEPEDEDDGDKDTDVPTKDDAVTLATKLVSNGEAAKVKKALSEVGAKRVSELKDDDQIAKFIDSLS